MSGKLTTHVLDIANGCPACHLTLELWSVDAEGHRQHLKSLQTNADGRTDEPLLMGDELQLGQYQLIFAVADYFRNQGINLPEPPFLDQVIIQFGIADPQTHYHVPLLTSPWSYSTYRGS